MPRKKRMIEKNNAQAAFDNVALLGLILLVAVAVFYYAGEASNTNAIYLTDTVKNVEGTVESLSNLGDGSADTIVVRTPKGVNTAGFPNCPEVNGIQMCKTLQIVMDNGEEHNFELSYPVWGSLGFFFLPGTHYVTMVNDGDNQRIVFQECGDGLVSGSEQCEACKTAEDCDDQYSSGGVNCEIPLGEEWGYCTYEGNGGCLNGNTCREVGDPEGFGCYCECTIDDDCPSGTCLPGGICGGCENNGDCDAGEYCSLGNCIDCDKDGDEFDSLSCGGNDCNDNNESIHPDVLEEPSSPGVGPLCTDGIDNNCNGLIDCQEPACDADEIICPGNGGGTSCSTNAECGAGTGSCYSPCIGTSCDACTSDLDCELGDACNLVSGQCCPGFSCERIASYSINNIYIDSNRNDWSIIDDEVKHNVDLNEPYYDLRLVIDRQFGFNVDDQFERGTLWLSGGKMDYGLKLTHEGHSSDAIGAAVGYAYEIEPSLGGEYLADALAADSFSFEFWFNSSGMWCSTSGQCPQQLIAGLYDLDLDNGLIVYLSQNSALSEQYLAVRFKDSVNTEIYYLDSTNVNDNNWHHFVLVRDVEAGEDRVYLDENLLTIIPVTSFVNLATLLPKPIFQISGGHKTTSYQHSDFDNFYSGWIDGVNFYTTAIDQDPNAIGNLNAAGVGSREDYCSPPPSDPYCGDGVINQFSEECDPPDMGGQTCGDFGGRWGDLQCTSNCKFDISGCWNSQCSDNQDNDGDGLLDFGNYPGINDPGCLSPMDNDESDTLDPYCGDGEINQPGEKCEAGIACPPGFFCGANTCSCIELPEPEVMSLGGTNGNLPMYPGLPFSCPPPGTCKPGAQCDMFGMPIDLDGDGCCDSRACAMVVVTCDNLCDCPGPPPVTCTFCECGNGELNPGESCDPPGSQCSGSPSGSGTCQADCSCLDNCVGENCVNENWWEEMFGGWF